MTKKISVPRGTADILPADIPLWNHIEKQSRQCIEQYGYREIRTPIFEDSALFKRSLGQTSDVVNKQLLELAGDKKDGFALRPEGTAAVVRSYIENNLDRQEQLSKLYYIGSMFRGERPQKGRLREFHQIGVEAIGPKTSYPLLDAEMITLSVELLKRIGLTGFQLKINTLGTPEDKQKLSDVLRSQLEPYKTELCEDCQARMDRNVFRVLDCKNRGCKEIVSKLTFQDEYLSEESQDYYKQVKEGLDLLGISYEESPCLVRGLDYYTHTVFEISNPALGAQDALGAGGRYNKLVAQLGGSDEVHACGFALGMERLILSLEDQDLNFESSVDALILTFSDEALTKGFEVVHQLRKSGIKADLNFKTGSMKSQMRLANKVGAKNVLIIGDDELVKNAAAVKNMETGEQEEIKFESLVKFFGG